ncbi:MAG: chloride channel protein [Sphaerochaetaceae bacterium]
MNTLKEQTLWVIRAVALGLLVGPACYALSAAVGFAQQIRIQHWWGIFALPPAAAAIALLYNRVDPVLRESSGMTMDIINWNIRKRISPSQKDEPQRRISFLLAPVVFASTFVSHLAGASIGKEGAGVQIGTSIASFMCRMEKRLFRKKRESDAGIWLCIGSGAAFGALFKAPIAGTLFGIMVASPNITRFDAMLPCLAGSLMASLLSSALGIKTPFIAGVTELPWSVSNIMIVLLLGIAAGLGARLFMFSIRGAGKLAVRFFPRQYTRVAVCGTVLLCGLLAVYLVTGELEYAGLSVSLMNDSRPWSFALKLALTAVAISAGFTGGEVVPALVVGASLFRSLSVFVPLPVETLAVFGAVGMLSGTTNLPLVCLALGIEMFGFVNVQYLFIICVMAFIVSGPDSIYPNQLAAVAEKPAFEKHAFEKPAFEKPALS